MPAPAQPFDFWSNFTPRSGGKGGIGGSTDPSTLNMLNSINQYLVPQLRYQAGLQSPITQASLGQFLTPGADFGQAETAAEGYGANLFRVGGPLTTSINKARGGMAGQGFAPSGAESSVNAITRGGVNDIANYFAQQAGGLENTRMNILNSMFSGTNQNVQDLINSILTGGFNVQQLQLAQKSAPKKGLLGLGFGPF